MPGGVELEGGERGGRRLGDKGLRRIIASEEGETLFKKNTTVILSRLGEAVEKKESGCVHITRL